MNIKLIFKSLGNILKLEAILMLLPLIVSLIYEDNNWYSFLIPAVACFGVGIACSFLKPDRKTLYAKEGFIVVGLCWIVLSLFGCVPFMISQEIPNFFDAFFETVSGFTTTGSTILTNIEAMSKSMLFWRSFTHWIGGMGILVFVLAFLPKSEGQNIHILRAESTGPQVGKLVSKLKLTARILYLIYIAFTILEVCFLYFGDKVFGHDGLYKMDLFSSLVHTFGTVGTGGFGIKATGLADYSTYSQMVIAIFMLLCGINFNVFYLILIGKFKQVLKCEEMWWYLGFIIVSTVSIAFNVYYSVDNLALGIAFKDSFFQVTSIITSTGFATIPHFSDWPALSQTILWVLMFVGACAGSTGGGIKVSRVVILLKTVKREIKKLVHPNSVSNIKMDGQTLDESVVKGVSSYFAVYITIFIICILILSFNGFGFQTNVTAVTTCLNNIGPGLDAMGPNELNLGPSGSFTDFSSLSKFTLSAAMLIGRLEIYPILILFNPKIWMNK